MLKIRLMTPSWGTFQGAREGAGSFETRVTTSNGSDFDLVGLDYSEDSNSRDEEEDEKEEEDLTLGDPEEDSDSRRGLDAF